MIDLVAFKTELEVNSRYDSAVRGGHNRELLVLLKEIEPGKTVFRPDVPVSEVRATIGNGVKGLSSDNVTLLNFQVPTSGVVDFSQQGVRDAIDEVFASKQGVLNRISTMRSRPRSWGEAFGGQFNLKDLHAVLPQISKSKLATYMADSELNKQVQETKIVDWLVANPDTSDPPKTSSYRRSDAIKAVLDG